MTDPHDSAPSSVPPSGPKPAGQDTTPSTPEGDRTEPTKIVVPSDATPTWAGTAETPTPGADTPDDNASTDGVRLPTQSEIAEAVENQPTMPVPTPSPLTGPEAGPPANEQAGTGRRLKADDGDPAGGPLDGPKAPTLAVSVDGPVTRELEPLSLASNEEPWSSPQLPAMLPSPGATTEPEIPARRMLPLVTVLLAILVVILVGVLLVRP